jgi:hypothetical protein
MAKLYRKRALAIDPIWAMIAGYVGVVVVITLAVVWYIKRR